MRFFSFSTDKKKGAKGAGGQTGSLAAGASPANTAAATREVDTSTSPTRGTAGRTQAPPPPKVTTKSIDVDLNNILGGSGGGGGGTLHSRAAIHSPEKTQAAAMVDAMDVTPPPQSMPTCGAVADGDGVGAQGNANVDISLRVIEERADEARRKEDARRQALIRDLEGRVADMKRVYEPVARRGQQVPLREAPPLPHSASKQSIVHDTPSPSDVCEGGPGSVGAREGGAGGGPSAAAAVSPPRIPPPTAADATLEVDLTVAACAWTYPRPAAAGPPPPHAGINAAADDMMATTTPPPNARANSGAGTDTARGAPPANRPPAGDSTPDTLDSLPPTPDGPCFGDDDDYDDLGIDDVLRAAQVRPVPARGAHATAAAAPRVAARGRGSGGNVRARPTHHAPRPADADAEDVEVDDEPPTAPTQPSPGEVFHNILPQQHAAAGAGDASARSRNAAAATGNTQRTRVLGTRDGAGGRVARVPRASRTVRPYNAGAAATRTPVQARGSCAAGGLEREAAHTAPAARAGGVDDDNLTQILGQAPRRTLFDAASPPARDGSAHTAHTSPPSHPRGAQRESVEVPWLERGARPQDAAPRLARPRLSEDSLPAAPPSPTTPCDGGGTPMTSGDEWEAELLESIRNRVSQGQNQQSKTDAPLPAAAHGDMSMSRAIREEAERDYADGIVGRTAVPVSRLRRSSMRDRDRDATAPRGGRKTHAPVEAVAAHAHGRPQHEPSALDTSGSAEAEVEVPSRGRAHGGSATLARAPYPFADDDAPETAEAHDARPLTDGDALREARLCEEIDRIVHDDMRARPQRVPLPKTGDGPPAPEYTTLSPPPLPLATHVSAAAGGVGTPDTAGTSLPPEHTVYSPPPPPPMPAGAVLADGEGDIDGNAPAPPASHPGDGRGGAWWPAPGGANTAPTGTGAPAEHYRYHRDPLRTSLPPATSTDDGITDEKTASSKSSPASQKSAGGRDTTATCHKCNVPVASVSACWSCKDSELEALREEARSEWLRRAQADSEIMSLRDKLAKLQKQVTTNEEEAAECESELSEANTVIARQLERIKELTAEVDSKQQQHFSTMEVLAEAKTVMKQQHGRIEELFSQLNDEKHARKTADHWVSQLRDQCARTQDVTEDRDSLRRHVSHLQGLSSTLEKQFHDERRARNELQLNYNKLWERGAQLEASERELQRQLDGYKRSWQQVNAEAAQAREEAASMRAYNEHLKSKLREAQAQTAGGGQREAYNEALRLLATTALDELSDEHIAALHRDMSKITVHVAREVFRAQANPLPGLKKLMATLHPDRCAIPACKEGLQRRFQLANHIRTVLQQAS